MASTLKTAIVPLSDCCTAIRGVTFASSAARLTPFDGSIGCLTTSAVQEEVDWKSARYIPEFYMRSVNQVVQEGDLLVSTANSKALVGKLAFAHDVPTRMTFGAFVTVLRPRPIVAPHYLFHCLRSERVRTYFFEKSSETTNISNLGTEDMLALEIPLPPLAEQVRIAAQLTEQLSAVERAHAAALSRLTDADALSAAYLREVFESPEVSEWKEFELGELVRTPIHTGISKTGQPDSHKRCLTLSAVRGRTLLLEKSKPVDVTDSEAEGNWLRPGCFYVVRGNGNRELVGRGAFAPDVTPRQMLFPDLLFQVDLVDNVEPSFFWCLWRSRSVRSKIEELARTAAGIYKINTANLNSLRLRLPEFADQHRIAADLTNRLTEADRLTAIIRDELAAIEALPAALLRAAFIGND